MRVLKMVCYTVLFFALAAYCGFLAAEVRTAYLKSLVVGESVAVNAVYAIPVPTEVAIAGETVWSPIRVVNPSDADFYTSKVPIPAKPPRSLTDAVAAACKRRFSGTVATHCYYDVLAIAKFESGWRNVSGDRGKSHGAFQLYTVAHPDVSRSQAEDFGFAAEWTVNHLQANGYPAKRTWAIGTHNSKTPHINAAYAAKVNAVSVRLAEAKL